MRKRVHGKKVHPKSTSCSCTAVLTLVPTAVGARYKKMKRHGSRNRNMPLLFGKGPSPLPCYTTYPYPRHSSPSSLKFARDIRGRLRFLGLIHREHTASCPVHLSRVMPPLASTISASCFSVTPSSSRTSRCAMADMLSLFWSEQHRRYIRCVCACARVPLKLLCQWRKSLCVCFLRKKKPLDRAAALLQTEGFTYKANKRGWAVPV